MSANMDGTIPIGTRVKTVKPDQESKDWNARALAARKWGVMGKTVKEHDAHGLFYDVEHEDGTMGYYEPRELEAVAAAREGEGGVS